MLSNVVGDLKSLISGSGPEVDCDLTSYCAKDTFYLCLL